MSDSAKGPVSGYLFQFEKALLTLASLGKDEYVTIESVDDIVAHEPDDTVLCTIQAKHSLASSGTTFEDTSYALWRTIQIWIEKLESGVFVLRPSSLAQPIKSFQQSHCKDLPICRRQAV